MKPAVLLLILAHAVLLPAAALAQDSYVGGGVAYSSGESEAFRGGPPTSSDLDAGMVTLIFGQRFPAGNGFWGWEASADLSFGAEANSPDAGGTCDEAVEVGPYLCKHDATLRLVGTYGAPLGQGTDVYGSLGLGMMIGDYSDSLNTVESASTYGLTVGVGLNREFANGLVGRGELIYDNFNRDTQSEGFSSNYTGATIRLGILRRF